MPGSACMLGCVALSCCAVMLTTVAVSGNSWRRDSSDGNVSLGLFQACGVPEGGNETADREADSCVLLNTYRQNASVASTARVLHETLLPARAASFCGVVLGWLSLFATFQIAWTAVLSERQHARGISAAAVRFCTATGLSHAALGTFVGIFVLVLPYIPVSPGFDKDPAPAEFITSATGYIARLSALGPAFWLWAVGCMLSVISIGLLTGVLSAGAISIQPLSPEPSSIGTKEPL